jgi:hypothetical protein
MTTAIMPLVLPFLLLVAAPPGVEARPVPSGPQAQQMQRGGVVVQYAQMTFQQRIVIRVPRLPDPSSAPASVPPARAPVWVEKKGPKCVAIPMIAGASVTRNDSVDLVTVDGGVLRARFHDDCPALDFYTGFYMKQTADGRVCANRDALRSRSGGSCRIKQFRQLVRKR